MTEWSPIDGGDAQTSAPRPRHRVPLVLFAYAWTVYLGFVGPWLLSEPSTVSVLSGVFIGLALASVTYCRLKRPSTTKENAI